MKKFRIPNVILYILSIWLIFVAINENKYFYLIGSLVCIVISIYHNWQDKNTINKDITE